MHKDSEDKLAGICCQSCLNNDKNKFTITYTLKNAEVLTCSLCGFLFIPPYWRKQITYESYKSAAVAEQIRRGNNWLKIQRHKLRLKLIQKYIPSGTMLDVGSGWGHFLLAAQEAGYKIKGVELDKEPFLYSVNDLKLPVENRNFFDFTDKETFDILTLWDVLEHIDQADAFVANCARLTNEGGYLVLQVPQIDSWVARRKKDSWNMMGLDHVNYFSRSTIRNILGRHGYEVETIKSSIELKLFLMYTILPYLKRRKKQTSAVSNEERQAYYNKVTVRPMWQLKVFVQIHNLVYNLLSLMNVGEEMIVVARKRSNR
jgi:SAM-dependent methyltransferase